MTNAADTYIYLQRHEQSHYRICTEDLVHMFAQMGVDTGVDLERLIAAAELLPAMIGHDVPGQVVKAGTSDRRYPLPDSARA